MLAEPSAFMAFAGIRKEHKRDEAAIKVAPSDANVSEDEANKRTIDNTITPITSASNEKATAPKSNAIIGTPSAETNMAVDKPGSRPKANLMDLDMGQETTQPVLQFTAPRVEEQPSPSFDQLIEKLTESAHLSPAQMKILKSIQVQVHEREKVDTPVSEAPRPETYTRSELESLRPKAAAPRVTTGTKTAAPRVTTGTKTAAPKVTTGIAKKLAEERDAFFIGEHVHKTRFHKTAASLTENFQKLTISDNTPVQATAASLPTIGNPTIDNPEDEVISDETSVEATAASLPTIEYPVKKLISVEKEKSKTNPFGPPLDKRKGPSLPVHPLTQSVTENHAATTRNQYSGIGPPPDKRNGPSLPAHLLAQATTMDQGAAVRNQYLGVGRLPVNGKDPSLSAHLLAQSATADHGAVPRDQYTGGNSVLTSISNQQSAEDTTLSMRPTRRNMINQSGFYALTENRVTSVAAGKKGEDPLLVARKRGL